MNKVLEKLGLASSLELRAWQLEIYNLFLSNYKKQEEFALYKYAICGGQGVGKSTFIALLLITHLVISAELYPQKTYRAAVYAGTEGQLKKSVWPEIRSLIQMSRILQPMFEVDEKKIGILKNKAFRAHICVCNKSNIDSMKGQHGQNMLIIVDEATAVADLAFGQIETFFTSGSSHWFLMSNSSADRGFFYDMFTQPNDWFKRRITRFDVQTDDPFAKEMEKRYGLDSDEYRVRVLSEFPMSMSNTLIPRYILDDAANRPLVNTNGAYAIGVDVSTGESANYSAYAVVNALGFLELYNNKIMHIEFLDLITSRINYYGRKSKTYVYVDAIGVGFGLFSDLQARFSQHRNVVIKAVKANERPKNNELNFKNRKAELYFDLRSWLVDVACMPGITNMDLLVSQLRLIQIELRNGLLNIVSKDEIEEPVDLADAASYAMSAGSVLNVAVADTSRARGINPWLDADKPKRTGKVLKRIVFYRVG